MARAGRKRKPAAPRHPCGKIRADARDRQGDARAVVKAQRLARGATEATWAHAEHETPFGRLYVSGAFSSPTDPDQAKSWYQAGLWFGGLWRSMRAAIAAQPPHARAPGGATAAKGTPPGESDLLRAIARHRAAERVLTRLEIMAIWEIIMVEREVTPAWLVPHLLTGLPKLVAVREGL